MLIQLPPNTQAIEILTYTHHAPSGLRVVLPAEMGKCITPDAARPGAARAVSGGALRVGSIVVCAFLGGLGLHVLTGHGAATAIHPMLLANDDLQVAAPPMPPQEPIQHRLVQTRPAIPDAFGLE